MFQVEWLVAIVLGIVGVVVIGIAATAIRNFRTSPEYVEITANPTASEVLKALEGYAWQAIATGERAVVWGLDRIEEHIENSDKKAVADYWYNLLPETIVVNGIPIPINVVKTLVTNEAFETFVKNLYDGFNAKVHTFEAQLVGQIDALIPDEYEDAPLALKDSEAEKRYLS